MKIYLNLFLGLAVIAGLSPFAIARGPGGGMTVATPAAAFAKIFGNNTSFSATAEMTMSGEASRPTTLQYYMRDGVIRMNMDISKMGNQLPPDTLARMKQMGMAHYATIIHPGTGRTATIIYPDLKAYVEVPPPHIDQAGTKALKVEKTKIGTDKVDGHPCVKYKIVVTRADGVNSTITDWEATDLKNFPIQMEMADKNGVTRIRYTHIDQSKPDASLFAAPAGYTKYDNMRSLMMSQMGKMMGGIMGHH